MFPLMSPPPPRLCECTEAEAETILLLKNELREKELKLTDIRLEALSSAHHLDQIREAMNRMQVRAPPGAGLYRGAPGGKARPPELPSWSAPSSFCRSSP